MLRLTKVNIEKILELNEGFRCSRSYSGKNFSETNHYMIHAGQLLRNSVGKTSWADSRFDKDYVCNIEETRRFLKTVIDRLKTPD